MNADQQAALLAPFPPEQIGKLPRAGIQLDYVGHAAVTKRLLDVDPEWTWEPVAFGADGLPLIHIDGNDAVLWIRLTVGGVTRLGVGMESAKSGDLEKKLISDALRNAAVRFGVAVDLWSKEDLQGGGDGPTEEREQPRRGRQRSQPRNDDDTADRVRAAVLDLCGGDRQLANRAWREVVVPNRDRGATAGDVVAAVEAWVNSPMEASDLDGPGVTDGVQLPVGDPQQRPAGGPHGVGGSGPSADPHLEVVL